MSLGSRTRSPHREDRSDGRSSRAHSTDGDPFANLDPTLHPATLNSVSGEGPNPLTDFAQHVLDGRDNELLGFGEDEQNLLAMGEARLDTLLEAAHKTEQERTRAHPDDDDFHFSAAEPINEAVVVEEEHGHEHEHDHPPPPPPSNGMKHIGRNKRRRDGEEIVVGPVENGEPIDPIKMKKDSHKEVERRRRENINDGINEIARYIPGGMDKMGKGQLLRRAAEYLDQVTARIARFDEELAERDQQKQEVESQLAHAQERLQEEHARSMRFETSWREAEDRAANQQFELQRVKQELEDLSKKLGEKA